MVVEARVGLEVDTDGDGLPDFTNSDVDTIIASTQGVAAFVHLLTSPFGPELGEGAAYQDKFGLNAVYVDTNGALGDAARFLGNAGARYRSTVRTPAPLTGTIPFTFIINGGELRIIDFARFSPNGSDPGVTVSAEVGVGGEAWKFIAGIGKTAGGNPIVSMPTIDNLDPFNLGIHPTLTPVMVDADGDTRADDVVVTIPRMVGTVLIDGSLFGGPLPGGVVFDYLMTAGVDMRNSLGAGGFAAISDPFALGTPNDPSDDLGGSISPLGVEFFLNGQPFSDFPIIPEPTTSAILAWIGLATLARRGHAHSRPRRQ